MPFKSKAQMKWMFANKPQMAKEWAAHTLNIKSLPSMAKPNKNAPLGQGGRFAALKKKLSGRKGVSNPGALAAYIGRKKYGTKKFAGLSSKGRKNA